MWSQLSLSAGILAAFSGAFIAVSPPHHASDSRLHSEDFVSRIGFTSKHSTKILLSPWLLVALHTSALAWHHPSIPASLLRHGHANGLNQSLITWSPSTAVPIALVLAIGVPLRLVSYSGLGHNFTFALAKPDRLTTTGIYRYLQHPSYTGFAFLFVPTMFLLGRVDGAFSCWIPPTWFPLIKTLWNFAFPLAMALCMVGIRKRVGQEERMLKAEFGKEWEEWHAKTARFVPFLI